MAQQLQAGVRNTAVSKKGRSFRPEIEGLRALAIGLVLIYHAGAPIVRGGFVGVDVFFVISGFLITSHILREVEQTGRLNLVGFWGRRMKRLLPAALTVFLATAVGTILILPNTSWRSIGSDIVAAASYVVNWRFAAEAVDYNAEGGGVSPLLHFWSLSVEEQFYVIWPIALVLAISLSGRNRSAKRMRIVTGMVIAVVAVPSLVWSVYYTQVEADQAFFITTTRLWELGAGAAVAVGAGFWHKLPQPVSWCLGWGGTVAIACSALAFDSDTSWPGSAALLPVLGTAAIIIATTGRAVQRGDAAHFFSWKPFVWVGSLSYSWYLWHWPILVLTQEFTGELRLRYKLLLVLVAGVFAWLSLKLIEDPIRRAKSLSSDDTKAISLGINFTLTGVIAGLMLILLVPSSVTATGAGTQQGARALTVSESGGIERYEAKSSSEGVAPYPADATADLPAAELNGCITRIPSVDVIVCDYGDSKGQIEVTLVGDSKALQWQPAIDQIGQEQGWAVKTYLKLACAFTEPGYALDDDQRQNCAKWNEATMARILADKPDIVITSGRQVFDGIDESGKTDPGAKMIANWWMQLESAGIEVIPLLDNPAPDQEVYECVAKNPENVEFCEFDKDSGIAKSGAKFQVPAANLAGITELIDVSDITCPTESTCPAIIGDVLVYRQGSHLTNTFVESAVGLLSDRLVPIVQRLAN